jgi:hypothetical protein
MKGLFGRVATRRLLDLGPITVTGLDQREKRLTEAYPPYGPKVPYRWLIRIDTLLLRIKESARDRNEPVNV